MPILITKKTFKILKTQNQTKKLPLKIQKPKISLKSQNVRKLTPTKYAHYDYKTTFKIFQTQKSNPKITP